MVVAAASEGRAGLLVGYESARNGRYKDGGAAPRPPRVPWSFPRHIPSPGAQESEAVRGSYRVVETSSTITSAGAAPSRRRPCTERTPVKRMRNICNTCSCRLKISTRTHTPSYSARPYPARAV